MVNLHQSEKEHRVAELVAVRSRGKLVAYLAARFRDVAAAEDALSEAFASALSTWPVSGCPSNPEAWLLTVARHKLIDQMRGSRETISIEELQNFSGETATTQPNELPDRRLELLFTCTHPTIDPSVRAPLMLQTVLGLEAAQIASAFLCSPAAMAKRLVRAKTKIRDSRIPFVVPGRRELPQRVDAVMESVYACFSEGWNDPTGTDLARRDLSEEALFLGKLLAELLPSEPEAQGLLALMLYTTARRAARRSCDGKFIPLAQQNQALWDEEMIVEAEAFLHCASSSGKIGRYQLEAAIQSAHISGARAGAVPWSAIVSLYDALVRLTASPVAMINRAVAVAEVEGPEVGLSALETLAVDRRVHSYQPYWAVRADLLAKTGAPVEARQAYLLAIGLERDPALRQYLSERSQEVRD